MDEGALAGEMGDGLAVPGFRDLPVLEPSSSAPVLEARPRSLAARLAAALGWHPMATFVATVLAGFVVVAMLSMALGLLVTRVLLSNDSLASADERLPAWLAGRRSTEVLDASFVGSIIAGGVVLPILVGALALAFAAFRRWRMAAFVVVVLAFESGVYRATTLAAPRDRPDVERLEALPADASYPSGHTAAAVAVYCGIALLLTSRIRSRRTRAAVWLVALALPLFVAFARIARGMHHPIDAAAGVVVGVAAIVVLVIATRAAGHAATLRRRHAR